MVQIIRRGVAPKDRKYVASCRMCGTQFSFLQNEAVYMADQKDGDYLRVVCPLPGCTNRVITVNASAYVREDSSSTTVF